MVNEQDYQGFDTDQKLMYDLRMTWAWTMHRYDQMIFFYKAKNDFFGWYNTMIKMWPKVLGRVKKKKRITMEKFEEIKDETKQVLNEHTATYLNRKPTTEGIEKLTEALNNMELFLELIKERNNMYGTAISESVY